MAASTQVLEDQESQQEHWILEGNLATVASSKLLPCHCPKTLCPLHSHVTKNHPGAPSPSPHGNRGALTRTSMLRHWLTFHWHRQLLFSMHLPRHHQLHGHTKTHIWFHQRIWGGMYTKCPNRHHQMEMGRWPRHGSCTHHPRLILGMNPLCIKTTQKI